LKIAELARLNTLKLRRVHIGQSVTQALTNLLHKTLPNHLEHLELMDCRYHQSIGVKLMDVLTRNCSSLRKLSLEKCNLVEPAFLKVSELIPRC